MEGILGESQTFIGVLTTVVVLCVVTESGNFVFKIFESIIESTEEEIHSIQDKVSETITKLLKFWENSDLKELIQKADSFKQISKEKKSEIITQQMMFELKTSQYSLSFSEKYFLPIYAQIDLIKYSKEQTFSPLFIFAYCLVVFLCDELVCWFGYLKPFMVTFLSIFTCFTFVYLLVIWLKFCKEYRFSDAKDQSNTLDNTSTNTEPHKYPFKTAAAISACCITIFFLAALATYPLSVRFSSVPIIPWVCRIILFIALVVPIAIVANMHINIRRVQGQYSHRFLLVHFAGLLIDAVLYSLILSFPQVTPDCVLFSFSENLWLLKSFIIITIIVNGVVFPFFFPYCGNCYVLKYTKQNSQTVISDAGDTYSKLEKWAQQTRSDIHEIITNNTIKILETKGQKVDKRSKFKKILDIILKQ